jgi:hypothetical protein
MSGIIYESETGEGLGRFEIDLADDSHRLMTVNITEEGIIMDVYQTVNVFDNPNAEPVDERAEHLGTMGMMFDEWADEVVSFDSPTKLSA